MAAISSFPTSGNVPLVLSPDLFDPNMKKRKRVEDDMVAMKYTFKPGSMSSATNVTIEPNRSGSRVLRADTTSHGTQVFDIKQEQSKPRECVLVYDEATHTFTLHALPTTLHLILNRSASSASSARPTTTQSSASSSSPPSSTQPLASKKPTQAGQDDTVKPIRSKVNETGPKPKDPVKSSQGGKTLPQMPTSSEPSSSVPPAASTKGRGKAGAKKSIPIPHAPGPSTATKKAAKKGTKAKLPPTPAGKYKSSEIIEDSDEEAGMVDLENQQRNTEAETNKADSEGLVEEEDEFAKMLQENLNEPSTIEYNQTYEYDDEDDDDDEEEEDDEDELGGAVLALRQQAPNAFGNGESEWL